MLRPSTVQPGGRPGRRAVACTRPPTILTRSQVATRRTTRWCIPGPVGSPSESRSACMPRACSGGWLSGSSPRRMSGPGMAAASADTTTGLQTTVQYLFSALNVVLGLLLVARRPDETVPRLLGLALLGTAATFNLPSHRVFHLIGMPWPVAAIHFTFHIVSGVAYAWAVVLFPDGTLPSRLRFGRTALVLSVVGSTVVVAFVCWRGSFLAHPQFFVVFFGVGVALRRRGGAGAADRRPVDVRARTRHGPVALCRTAARVRRSPDLARSPRGRRPRGRRRRDGRRRAMGAGPVPGRLRRRPGRPRCRRGPLPAVGRRPAAHRDAGLRVRRPGPRGGIRRRRDGGGLAGRRWALGDGGGPVGGRRRVRAASRVRPPVGEPGGVRSGTQPDRGDAEPGREPRAPATGQ